ncbi:MAG: hypothetical protein H0T42_22005, partial [Deltaproteobacteria bacterium]|nr:hypothetical protein [Deltaproteobacteria bacterium]
MRFALLVVMCVTSGCLDELPDDPTPPAARVVTSWDPRLCRDPRQRVVVELEDDDGFAMSSSAGCVIGGLTIDARKWGFYSGVVYSWMLGEPMRAVMRVTLAVDAPVIR